MLTSLRTLAAAPVFEKDEEKTRIARLLNLILIVVMVLLMVFSVPAFLMTPQVGRVLIELILAAWSAVMLVVLRRGYVRPAAFLLSLTLWGVVSYGTYEAGGLLGSTLSAYFGIILIAELLLGTQAGIILGLLSIAVTGVMLIGHQQGWMPQPAEYATLPTFWIEFSVVVIGVLLLLSLVMSSLRQALERARRNEQELVVKVKEIEALARKATEANEFRAGLIARISHELRTPLGALMGMAEMLQHDVYGPLTPAQHDISRRIINNAHALEQVFAELLDQSQIESGQLRLKEQAFAPQAIVERVCSVHGPLAQGKGIELKAEVDPRLPGLLLGDQARIEQILSNLVVNAIKFTDSGRVSISVQPINEGQWTLQVRDTGIGIMPEAQAFIFEPFRQVDESVGRRFGGVGLGLAIVQQLVKAMEGDVHLESELGHGSVFTVTLPLRRVPEAVEN
jgi:signal transduction histidine kinase